jgi:S-DNA-T family DNA segregation ATPase FtsK/SpoIIIE
VEIPNADRETVRFKEMVLSPSFEQGKSRLTLCLGKDIVGNPVSAGLEKMPHLLIAGATGTGKSVALNTMICSLLYKATPDQVKLIMVDPKRIELSMYDGIPHLITPVVTDVKKATNALFWAVREMEHRYELLSEKKTRNIDQYNRKIEKEPRPPRLPKAKKPNGEPPTAALHRHHHRRAGRFDDGGLPGRGGGADPPGPDGPGRRHPPDSGHPAAVGGRAHRHHQGQLSHAPDLPGLFQNRFTHHHRHQRCRKPAGQWGYALSAPRNGATPAHPRGLYFRGGAGPCHRISQKRSSRPITTKAWSRHRPRKQADGEKEYDERYDDAVALVTQAGQASISMVQRHLRIGYNRAARIIEMMEQEGIVGAQDGVKPRQVLVKNYDDIS